jgi:hypothetical protein
MVQIMRMTTVVLASLMPTCLFERSIAPQSLQARVLQQELVRCRRSYDVCMEGGRNAGERRQIEVPSYWPVGARKVKCHPRGHAGRAQCRVVSPSLHNKAKATISDGERCNRQATIAIDRGLIDTELQVWWVRILFCS